MNRKKREKLADIIANQKQIGELKKGKSGLNKASKEYLEALEARIEALERAVNLDILRNKERSE
jgi:hypothetical protein